MQFTDNLSAKGFYVKCLQFALVCQFVTTEFKSENSNFTKWKHL